MEERQHRRRLGLFKLVALLVLAQVAWWTTIFLRDVRLIERLKVELLARQGGEAAPVRESIHREAFHQRLMFLSESSFFVGLACLALFLLYRALRAEEHSRVIQRNFIEIVTHESKTPLTAMKLRLQSILEKWGEAPALRRELGSALEEVRRLVSIFEKAMDLNRMERQVFHFESLSLDEVVTVVIRRLEPFLREKKVELSLALEPEAVVRGDAHCLQNAVQSLVENAVFYNPSEKKKISIAVKASPHGVVISVADDGPGIAQADRARIFERFYRGEGSQRVPGTGLGLYLTKTIIEAHHGVVRLAHSGEDGTRFEIELPGTGET